MKQFILAACVFRSYICEVRIRWARWKLIYALPQELGPELKAELKLAYCHGFSDCIGVTIEFIRQERKRKMSERVRLVRDDELKYPNKESLDTEMENRFEKYMDMRFGHVGSLHKYPSMRAIFHEAYGKGAITFALMCPPPSNGFPTYVNSIGAYTFAIRRLHDRAKIAADHQVVRYQASKQAAESADAAAT